jgi:hypothetical protein
MSGDNVELWRIGGAVVTHAYDTGDLEPLELHAQRAFSPDFVLEARVPALFTEGEWHGPGGFVRFVANQMEVLENMWHSPDEIVEVDDEALADLGK